MKTFFVVAIILCLLGISSAQNSSQTPSSPQVSATAPQGIQLQPGSLIYAELSKSVDAKKAKVGDPVRAKITEAVLSRGKVALPRNARIIGHLTSVKAQSKDQPQSELGIVFDRAELKDGTQVSLNSITIQAIGNSAYLSQSPFGSPNGADPSGMPSAQQGVGNMGGMNPPVRGSNYPSANAGTADGGDQPGTTPSSSSGRLNAGSHGAVGMSGVSLRAQPQGGVVTQDGKNVKLDGGTQLILRTQ